MEPEIESSVPLARKRRRGQRMNAAERKATQELFLRTLANTANVRAAALKAGIDQSLVYKWQEHDESFALRFREANTSATWLLFAEGWRRAVEGELEYVVSGGRVVMVPDPKDPTREIPLTRRVKSDSLLALYLKARLPEFREKSATIVNVLPKEYLFDPNEDGIDR